MTRLRRYFQTPITRLEALGTLLVCLVVLFFLFTLSCQVYDYLHPNFFPNLFRLLGAMRDLPSRSP